MDYPTAPCSNKLKSAPRDEIIDLRARYLNAEEMENGGQDGAAYSPELQENSATKATGSLMDLPPEIRLKIYHHLLVVDGSIILSASQRSKGAKPSIAILRACRVVNQEGTPILYGKNNFIVFLDLEPGPAYLVCFPMSLRWSSIPHIGAIAYKTNTMALSSFEAKFVVSGAEILERFTARDIHFSPISPDNYLALSIKGWVCREVIRSTMTAFHHSMSAAIMGHVPLP